MNITQEATAKNLAYNKKKMEHTDGNTTAGRARIELGQWTADSTQAYQHRPSKSCAPSYTPVHRVSCRQQLSCALSKFLYYVATKT